MSLTYFLLVARIGYLTFKVSIDLKKNPVKRRKFGDFARIFNKIKTRPIGLV